MSRTSGLPASLVVVAGALGAVVLSVAHLVNDATVGSRLLDADLENNIPTWYARFAFSCAALAAVAAATASAGRRRPAWFAVAALCFAFSVDEVASVHEEAGQRLGEVPTLSLTQPLAAVFVVLLLLVVARLTRGAAGRALGASAVVLFVSQALASTAGLHAEGRPLFLLEAAEDLTESLTAVGLLASGLLPAGHHLDLRRSALRSEFHRWWGGPVVAGQVSPTTTPAVSAPLSGARAGAGRAAGGRTTAGRHR